MTGLSPIRPAFFFFIPPVEEVAAMFPLVSIAIQPTVSESGAGQILYSVSSNFLLYGL